MNPLKFCYNQHSLEAGLDEAGCGSLSGPVYAAAVIWPNEPDPDIFDSDIKNSKEYHLLTTKGDSKKLTPNQRNLVSNFIKDYSIDYSIAYCSVQEIDKLNILQARVLAMHKAINNLRVSPESMIIDGTYFKNKISNSIINLPYTLIECGDAKFISIAAASILAKTERDSIMDSLHQKFPVYSWNTNKGYGTQNHYKALKENGSCIHHRKSFNLHI